MTPAIDKVMSETITGLLFLSFYGSLYIYPFVAIWMILSYTDKGSGRKKHFARWCLALALFSASVYISFLLIGHNWKNLGLPDMWIDGSFIDIYVYGFAAVYSPLLCMGICKLFAGKIKAMLSPEYGNIDVARLIRLGVMAGHASMSIPIGWYISR